jgi:type II secretory ATPase GspE/PulE/Tfp pilus assembly ATPase PilB-like protein
MANPAHKQEGNRAGDSGAPISVNMRVVQGGQPAATVGEGMAPGAQQEVESNDPLLKITRELSRKYKNPMRFHVNEGGPFLSYEDLVQAIDERPIGKAIAKKLEFLERHGFIPLTSYEGEEQGDAPGQIKVRERLVLAMRATQHGSKELINPAVFDYEWSDTLAPRLKRELPEIKHQRIDAMIVSNERFEDLKRVVNDIDYRRLLLGKIDPNAKAEKTFDELVASAVREGASDIHIQCIDHGDYKVRFRINGVLKHAHTVRHETGRPLIARLKICGDMKVDENRLPLDGRIFFTTNTIKSPETLALVKGYSMRVSIVFGQQGPTAVLRLLKSANEGSFKLDKLGFRPHVLQGIEEVLQTPNGVVLVTGPTGSGKTSTLYAALKRLDDGETNIITAEDPVEVSLTGITQVQVNRAINLGFPEILRSFLRQDPDVILVGEIRDQETAEVAVQAALTGHLVFATVHTNDAFGTLQRLRSLGIDNSKLQDTIRAVLSQRLVRKLCSECRHSVDIAPDLNRALGTNPDGSTPFAQPFMTSKSTGKNAAGGNCKPCKGTGFTGVFPVAEIWIPGIKEKDLIIEGNTRHEALYEVARQSGMIPIMHSALEDIKDGRTSYAECLARVFSVQDLRQRRGEVIKILGGNPGS